MKVRFAWQQVMNEQENYFSHNDYAQDSDYRMTKPLTLKDGTTLSIQASHSHYCTPRKTIRNYKAYTYFEIGFPSRMIKELIPFVEEPETPTDTVYGWVPKSVINKIIKSRGGVVVD